MAHKKSPAQLEREIRESLARAGDKRHVAHVGFGTYSQSPLPVKKSPPDPRRASLGPGPRSESKKRLHPEMFAVMNRQRKILGRSHSVKGAMALAPYDKSYVVVRGEFTSDGTNQGVGRGRLVATREGGRWHVEGYQVM